MNNYITGATTDYGFGGLVADNPGSTSTFYKSYSGIKATQEINRNNYE